MGVTYQHVIKYPSLPPSKDRDNEQQISDTQFTDQLLSQLEFYRNVKFAERVTDFLALEAFKEILSHKHIIISSSPSWYDKIRIYRLMQHYDFIFQQVGKMGLGSARKELSKRLDEVL